MSLMKLAPEAVRLRRVARAHAMGEFSLSEYRQARREVIVGFEAGFDDDDDTQPRFANGGAATAVASEQRPSRRGRRWLYWLLAAAALLAAAPLFAATDSVPIPAVAGRDPNPATSPRLAVASVTLAGHDEGLLVSHQQLEEVIAAKLAEIRQRNQPDSHGFTGAELEEVGRFLNALGAHGDGVSLSARDAADLSALLAEQKQRRGVSVVELEEIAAAVQAELRDAGYFLAVAFLPAQEVLDGQVLIDVLPGVVGEVRVSGAGGRLAKRFDDLLGQALTSREINTRLYALNQAPGFSARASFEPGEAVGETRLNLDVLEQRSLRGGVALDNHGDAHTGEQRLVLEGDLINPTGRGDVLSVGLMAALDPSNQLLGFADYTAPVGNRRQLRGRLARNDFSISGVNDLDAEGWLLDGVVETFLHRDRLTGLSWEAGIGHHSLSWQTESESLDQEVDLLSLALNARRVWDEALIAADLRLYADLGSIGGDTFAGQDDTFWDLGFNLFAWHPFDVPRLPGRQKASLLLKGQFAGSQLPSTRRLALGGVAGARGFERDIYLADQGAVLRLDLRTPVRLGELSLFADAAYGKNRNELTPGWAHLANLGLSWDVRVGRHMRSSISWAVPITTKGEGGLSDEGAKLYWSFRYAR